MTHHVVVSHRSYQSASTYLGPGTVMPPEVPKRVPCAVGSCPSSSITGPASPRASTDLLPLPPSLGVSVEGAEGGAVRIPELL